MSIHETIDITATASNNLMYTRQQTGWQGWAKAILDRSAAVCGLAVLSPLLLGSAVAIKLDSKGPIFFRQPRHGFRGEVFHVWKFRTMTVMETGSDFRQASKDDARITRLGRFLRRTSIDELPQLFNVLSGDMSLVGPRPHPVKLNEQFAPLVRNYRQRHAVKPGLTGLAQIRGYRGPTDTTRKMALRVESDLEYIRNWSIWLDIRILLATPLHLLTGKNAH